LLSAKHLLSRARRGGEARKIWKLVQPERGSASGELGVLGPIGAYCWQ
jgi:hypothetical protein